MPVYLPARVTALSCAYDAQPGGARVCAYVQVELIDFFEPEVELTPREYYEDEADGPDSD